MTEQLEGQMSIFDCFDPVIWSGRTCRAHFQAQVETEREKISDASLKKFAELRIKPPLFLNLRREDGQQADASWEMGGQLLGEYMMRSFGEYPSEERESRLSQILEERPLPKYSLSPRACQGILNRAERRGKELPPILREALIHQATPLKSGGGAERDSGGKKAGKGPLVQTELSGTLGISQDQTLITNKVYGISAYESNAMKSPNPHSGIYEAETTRTLDNNGGNPACNQGGMIVLEGNGSRESHKGNGYTESDKMYTLNTVEQHAIVDTYQKTTGSLCASGYDKLGTQEAANDMYVVQSCSWDGSQVSPTLTQNNAGGGQRMPDKDNFNAVVQSLEVYHCTTGDDMVQTLKARDYKDPQVVAYAVDCYNQTESEEVTKALNSSATDSDHIPCVYGIDRASFNQGRNAKYDFSVEEEKAQTLVSRGPGGGTDQTVGALCARDYKGVGSQYVNEGKCIIQWAK